MSEEKSANRIRLDGLSQPETGLSGDEQKKVRGGSQPIQQRGDTRFHPAACAYFPLSICHPGLTHWPSRSTNTSVTRPVFVRRWPPISSSYE